MAKRLGVMLGMLLAISAGAQEWEIKKNPLMTEWGSKITPENAWQEYPRPQMVRENWTNLNGLWDYAMVNKDGGGEKPDSWQGQILVPFAVESPLSGVKKWLRPHQYLWYKRSLTVEKKKGTRLLLHFEAVDYQAHVYVNGKEAGVHTGGSTPFRFDITELVNDGENELTVRVYDESDKRGGWQLVGKQTHRPSAIRYTQTSGIWQTVWLEEVPDAYLSRIKIDTAINPGTITVKGFVGGDAEGADGLKVTASFKGKKVASEKGSLDGTTLTIKDAKLWSVGEPNLYDLEVELLKGRKTLDTVTSYAGIRVVGKKKDSKGHLRFTLNDEIIFHWGPLDQGWWPDGLLTPPSDEAVKWDLQFMKDYGFNMVRVHIKVHPRRFYYHCDKMGLMVWQDQVSGGPGTWWSRMRMGRKRAPDKEWPEPHKSQFIYEMKEMIDHLYNSPAIVSWVPFNESWGQHNTMETGEWVVEYDKTRLINIASGGNFYEIGDIADAHSYPDPGFPLWNDAFMKYVKVVGEWGGYGYMPKEEHLWNPKAKHHGYGKVKPTTPEEFEAVLWGGINKMDDLKLKGVAGSVYTQVSDVENETNGLVTYDRKHLKISAEAFKKMSEKLLAPLPEE